MGLREKIKRDLRRIFHLSDPDEGKEGHRVEEVKSGQQPLQLPQVQLHFSSTPTATADHELSEAQIALQKSVKELESVLQAQLGQSSDKLQTSLRACLARSDNPQHAEPFENILAAVQVDRVDRTKAASSRAGAVMQKMYPLTKLALGLTGTLTSSLGYAPVQIVTNGLIQAFELAMSVPKQSEEVVAGLDSMAADDYLLTELQKMPVDVLDPPIVIGAIVLQTRLIEFLRKSILWLNKTFFAKFANCIIEPTQMTDARTVLRKAQDVLRNHLSVDTFLTMKWQKIAMVQAETLNSLCSNDYHTVHLLKQKELHSTRLENSGMWAVTDEKFKSWHGDAGGILWCPGLPGAGKTYLASRIVDELQTAGRHRDVGVAYVYCEHNPARKQSDRLVMEAMTRQLIAQKPDLCSDSKFKSSLQDPLPTTDERKRLFRRVLAQFETTFLVLDALDEFSTDYIDRNRLACTLRDILQDCSAGQVRLCITSREANGIWQALGKATIPVQSLDVRSSQNDIRALVEKAYDEASRDRAIGWTHNNERLRQLVIKKVVEKSDCIFQLAKLQIDAILKQPSAYDAKSALDRLTKDVNNYYNKAVKRIARQTETKDMVYNLLTWLAFTRSPIHVHELRLALSIRPGKPLDHDLDEQEVDVLRYVGLSEGLISIKNTSVSWPYHGTSDEDDERSKFETKNKREIRLSKGAQVTLAHESIREFLRDNPPPGSPANGDKFLLHCCLTIMSSPLFVGNLQPIWQEFLCREDFPDGAKIGFSVNSESSAVKVPIFLFWVLSSWGQYVNDSDLADMKNAIQKIREPTVVATRAWMREDGPRMKPLAGPLYWCAYEGWAEACKLLLAREDQPNAFWRLNLDRGLTHMTSETCLFAAVASGDIPTVQVFLDDDRVKPNLGKESYWEGHVTPLMRACEQGDRDIVRMLLSRNDVDVNETSDVGYGALLPAILRAKPGIISLLLERDDLDVNILRVGRRPIHHLANIGGSPSELELLLNNAKIDVNGRTEEQEIQQAGRYVGERAMMCFRHNRTALMVAAFVGHPAQTSVLLKHPRVEPQLRDSQGETALMLASQAWRSWTRHEEESSELQNSAQKHDETVRILLTSSDPAINEQDVRGRTALLFASMGGVDPKVLDEVPDGLDSELDYLDLVMNARLGKDHHVEIVKALLTDDKIEVNLPDNMGHTALDYAMWTCDFIIQERDWELQRLKKTAESLRGHRISFNGLYQVPDVDVQDMMAEAQSRIDAMSKVHDILVASGAQSGDPIGPVTIPQDFERGSNRFVVVEASEQRKMLDSLISAIENVISTTVRSSVPE